MNNFLNDIYKVINAGNCFLCNKDLPNKHNHEVYFRSDILECNCGFKFITYSRTVTLQILNMKFLLEFNYDKDLRKIVGYYDSEKLFVLVKFKNEFVSYCDNDPYNMICDLASNEDITLEKLRNLSYKINKINIFA